MKKQILREYIKELIFEMKMSGHENNENHMNFLKQVETLGFGGSTNDTGLFGEEYTQKFIFPGSLNTNTLYYDTFPFADIVTEQPTKENIENVVFIDVKTSMFKSVPYGAGGSLSKPYESLEKMMSFFAKTLDLSGDLNIQIALSSIKYKKNRLEGDTLDIEVFGIEKVPVTIEKDNQGNINTIIGNKTLSGKTVKPTLPNITSAIEMYGQPEVASYKLSNPEARQVNLQIYKKFKNQIKVLPLKDIADLSVCIDTKCYVDEETS